jgi:NAD(P)-dependent dehydrogenase (short-subunit alcohol dehydrogenase family)
MANYLVIAASSSIGKATTELLREAGHSVYTTARSDTKITPDALLDASNFEQVADVFLQAKQHLGNIDGVVNFAGSLLLKSAKSTTREEYDAVISSSLTTAFATVRSAAKEMSSGGSVVLISSAAASIGLANHEAIAAAKAGIIGLMLSAAATYAENNLRFNVVSPGLVDTDLTRRITNSTTALEYSLGMHPLGRVGKPMDIARAVLFFLDPLNTWITGQVLNVDGGLATLKTKR